MHTQNQLTEAEISSFCQQIVMVLKAGLPLYYGVSILLEEADDDATAAFLSRIYDPLERGSSLHDALRASAVFPPYLLHMVRLGETTGHLEDVLVSLSHYYEREADIREQVKSAVTYPLVLTFLMIAVLFVLFLKVIPVFSQVYAALGSELTGSARALLRISTTLNRYLLVFVLLFFVLLLLGIVLCHTDLGRVLFFGQKLSLTIAAGRVANCLHLALSSGLDTNVGLSLSHELVNNPHMQARIDQCRESMRQGESFEHALGMSGIFPHMYASWIALGARTGGMDTVMARICDACEAETEERINTTLSLLEPVLISILCFFVGLILLSFLLPLLGIFASIG